MTDLIITARWVGICQIWVLSVLSLLASYQCTSQITAPRTLCTLPIPINCWPIVPIFAGRNDFVKGSRGMQLDRFVTSMTASAGEATC